MNERALQAARYLCDLRAGGPRPRSLPPQLAPRDESEAYAVQRAVARALQLEPAGWKVAMSGPDSGTSAPIFATDIHRGAARVSCAQEGRLGIEPEVAFGLRQDLPRPPAGTRYSRERLLDAIDAAYAAIEIVVSRFRTHEEAEPLDRLADNISNGGLVLSAPCADWRRLQWAQLELRLRLSGPGSEQREQRARGGHPLGDPLAPLLWLINDRVRERDLKAGEIITTGSHAGLHYAPPGARVEVAFAGLGTASLEVS